MGTMSILKNCGTCTQILSVNRCHKCQDFCNWVDEKILWRDATEVMQWKKSYNEYLKQHEKAAKVMDDNSITVAKREKWLNNYRMIVMELDYIIALFDTDGIEYTEDEALNGFDATDTRKRYMVKLSKQRVKG